MAKEYEVILFVLAWLETFLVGCLYSFLVGFIFCMLLYCSRFFSPSMKAWLFIK